MSEHGRASDDFTCRLIGNWIKTRAPAQTATAVSIIESCEPFDAAEARATNRAVQTRRSEFHTGRRLARVALADLGCEPLSIPVGEARLPIWPNGYIGTISHTDHVCVAHVAWARNTCGLGVDLEPDIPLPADIAQMICHPDERRDTGNSTLIFVAKEAFYKAYFPIVRTFLHFKDVRVRLDPSLGRFEASLLGEDKPAIGGQRSVCGHYASVAGHLIAAVWISR